jgi:Protein of unknown function (DUF4199)
MFEKIPAWVKVATRYGLIGSAIGSLLIIVLYYIGRHPFLIPVMFDFRIILFSILLFFSLREFREYYQSGILYFWQGMLMCAIFTIVFALVTSFSIWLFATWKPEFVTEFVKLFQERSRAFPPQQIIDQIGKDAFEQTLQGLSTTKPIDMARQFFWQCVMISLFLSVIISVILRRQPKA